LYLFIEHAKKVAVVIM